MFAGAAWELSKKTESKIEIINGIKRELTNLYRCVKHHLGELVTQFHWMLVVRDVFDAFWKQNAWNVGLAVCLLILAAKSSDNCQSLQ